jgi:molybdopterin-synthase adenylyltransferase
MSFSKDELERYARHIMLKDVGGPGQQRLKAASVALIGAGGLGSPAALYLAAAGVGRMRLIDPDRVALSNLQRQILFRTEDAGRSKVEAAAEQLTALNPNVTVEIVDKSIDATNADALLDGCTVVLDGCDNFETRFAVSDSCWRAGRYLVSGAIGRWDGQLSTFVRGSSPQTLETESSAAASGANPQPAGTTSGALETGGAIPLESAAENPCYRCLVNAAPDNAEPCSMVGVVGPLCGIIGGAMALEALKIITGAGRNLIGRLAIFDALAWRWREVRLEPDPDCPGCSSGRTS